MNNECGNGWEREFLDGEFTRSFRLTTYKEHREKVLADRERARMPATQEDAAAMRNSVVIYTNATTRLNTLMAQFQLLQNEMMAVETQRRRAHRVMESYGRVRFDDAGRISHVRAEPAAFVKPCAAEGCKGFLSTAWKCGLCELFNCPDCHEVRGPARDSEHTCDADKVATARLLARDSRNCPKCGVTITKIDGCDQMFCTSCNTAFNWRTGKIADGPIHNPHYFAWLRTQGRDPAAAPAVGGVGNCDADLDNRIIRALYPESPYALHNRYMRSNIATDPDRRYMIEAWRLMREGQDMNNREPNMEERFRELRVKFLIDRMSEEDWKVALQRAEKDLHFTRAVRQIRDVYVGAVRDIIRQILNADHDKKEIRRQVEQLVEYCNTSAKEVSKRFGRKVPRYEIKG